MVRRLRRRVPVRLRQNWKVVAAGCAFLLIVVAVFGNVRVRPVVTSDSRSDTEVVTQDIAGTVDIFDSSTAHEITVSYSEDDYQRMLDEYFSTGEKGFIEASVVIDGTPIAGVGLRLKGNSTLASLVGPDGERAPNSLGGGGFRGGGPPDGAAQPEQGDARGGPGGGGLGGALSVDEPESLPWLVSFDAFVEGQRYRGLSELAVRPAGQAGTTSLNEAVSLTLAAQSGEPSQRLGYTAFTINDRPTAARLVVEHPDQAYAERLPGDGVLYKARAGGQFADQGEDPTEYEDDFKQVNQTGSQDLQPVIDLIRWVETASDEQFAAGLADRVDVESFARYVALHDLLQNFDDMSGPGTNYYLYYNQDTGRFSVLTWDLNLALNGGGFGGRQGGFQPPDGAELPEGFQPPEGAELPEGFQPPGDGEVPGGGQGPGGGFGQGNALKSRFLETPEFSQLVEQATDELRAQLYGSGAAQAALEQASAAALAAGADQAAVDSEAAAVRTIIETQTQGG
jgi:spore coat protein CotH